MTLATPEKTDLTCRELVELVTDYLEGALSSSDRLDFERHLVWCSFCRDYLDQMRATIELTGGATEDAGARSPLREQLLEAFRDWKRTRGVMDIAYKFTRPGARSPFTGFVWPRGEWVEAIGTWPSA